MGQVDHTRVDLRLLRLVHERLLDLSLIRLGQLGGIYLRIHGELDAISRRL